MRNKIDNLILFNLALIIVLAITYFVKMMILKYVGITLCLAVIVYEALLYKNLKSKVEKDARPRLRKRIIFNILQTFAIIILSTMVRVL